MKKKKIMKKTLSMLLLLVFLTGSVAGCGKTEAVVTDTSKTDETQAGQSGNMEPEANAADNELSGSLKKKYAGTASDKYQWANPIYNVERDHEFVYEQVGTRYAEEDTMYDDIKVYIDSNFVHPITSEMEYDEEKRTLTISPAEGDPALELKSYEDTEAAEESGKNWGNAPKYWIVQYNDFATGEALSKPVVTLFTVKAELDAPTVVFGLDEKGYAKLSWDAVPGAAGYRIYEMTESAEYGISMENLYLVGETTETSFADFDKKDESYNEAEGVTTQNMEFYDYGIKDGESGLSQVYCVVAVNGGKNSNVSNLIYQKDVRNRLVTSMVYDYEKTGEDAAAYAVVHEKIADLPAYQLVEMADTSIAPMPIDYANATWKENELGMADEGNLSIEIHAGIQGTDFKIVMYATQAAEGTIDSDIAALAERQKSLTGKSADVKPKNSIDYVPSGDSSDDTDEDSDAVLEEATDDSFSDDEINDIDFSDDEGFSDEELADANEDLDISDEEAAGEDFLVDDEINDDDFSDDEDFSDEELANANEKQEMENADEEEEALTDDAETEEMNQEATAELAGDEIGDIEVTATSALSEYIAIYMLNHEEAIDLSMFPEAGDSDYLVNAIMEAYNQNPLVGTLSRYGYDYGSSVLYLDYEYSKDEQKEMQEAVLAEADKVVSEIITDDMSEVEKEFAINNYLCSTAEYDYSALENAEANNFETVDHEYVDSFTPYGVLINKSGVCASYAGAFKVLADKADLDCYVVTGYLNGNLPHAWNRVALDDQWVTVDATNNDNEKFANALLNIPDYMSSGYLVEDNTYLLSDALEAMTADREESEFYRVENKYYAADELQAELEVLLAEGETFTIRTDYTMTEDELREILENALTNAGVSEARFYMFLGVLTVEMQ